MKNLLIILIVLLVAQTGFGQEPNEKFNLDSISYFFIVDNDTIIGNHETFSETDFKFKQYRKEFYKRNTNKKLVSQNKTIIIYDYTSQITPMVEGEYKNGEKFGKWIYWKDYGTEYSFCRQFIQIYSIDY